MDRFNYKNLYWIEGVICVYIGQTRCDQKRSQLAFRFVTMDIDQLDKHYEITDTQQIPSDLRTQAQKDLLKDVRTRRVTLSRKDFDYKDIKRVKGQRRIPIKMPNGYSQSNKDYESWISV